MKRVVSLFRGTVILMPREPYPMFQSRKSMLACWGVPSKRWGLVVVLLFLSNQVGMSQESTYTLPKDPKAEIVVYDEQVGFGLPRQNPGAVLTILRDGTVTMPDIYGRGQSFKGRLDEQELQALLRFVIGEKKFFEFDSEKVKAEMKAAEAKRPIPQIADAPVQVFEVQTAKRQHRVSHYALGMASEYPEIEALQQLFAIQKRLRRVMNETRVGGKSGVQDLLELVNRELKSGMPDAKPFTLDEFTGSSARGEDGVNANFFRRFMGDDGRPNGKFIAALIEISGADARPKVTLRSELK